VTSRRSCVERPFSWPFTSPAGSMPGSGNAPSSRGLTARDWRTASLKGGGAGRASRRLGLRPDDRDQTAFRRFGRAPRGFLVACSVPAPGLRASTRCGRHVAHHGKQGRLGREAMRGRYSSHSLDPQPRPVRLRRPDALLGRGSGKYKRSLPSGDKSVRRNIQETRLSKAGPCIGRFSLSPISGSSGIVHAPDSIAMPRRHGNPLL